MMSVVYSLFHPLGLIAPNVMKAKLLLQELCRKKQGWDDDINEHEKQQWLRWLEDLPRLEVDVNESIYCCFVLGKARLTPIQEIAIPKLELSGAVISVHLRQTIKE